MVATSAVRAPLLDGPPRAARGVRCHSQPDGVTVAVAPVTPRLMGLPLLPGALLLAVITSEICRIIFVEAIDKPDAQTLRYFRIGQLAAYWVLVGALLMLLIRRRDRLMVIHVAGQTLFQTGRKGVSLELHRRALRSVDVVEPRRRFLIRRPGRIEAHTVEGRVICLIEAWEPWELHRVGESLRAALRLEGTAAPASPGDIEAVAVRDEHGPAGPSD